MIKEKRTFYREISYVLGLILMSFGAAFTELAGLGMSMVVAPTYILYLKLSEFLPWFSFGIAEYMVQGLLILLTFLITRHFKISYLFSFITAILYGALLDLAMFLIKSLATEILLLHICYFAIGTLLCATAVSLFFHTYLAPEAYELIVKEAAKKFSFNINKVKTFYDCISTAIAIILSFAFFGFGTLKGIGIGTIVCALINGFLIGRISRLFEHFFEFKNKFNLEKLFN